MEIMSIYTGGIQFIYNIHYFLKPRNRTIRANKHNRFPNTKRYENIKQCFTKQNKKITSSFFTNAMIVF